MDPEQYADAVARLEQAYVEGGMSADEYTRQRHELEQRASTKTAGSGAGHLLLGADAARADGFEYLSGPR